MAVWNEPKSNYVASDEVTPQIFNELAENEKYLKQTQDTKITSAQVKDATINNTQHSIGVVAKGLALAVKPLKHRQDYLL